MNSARSQRLWLVAVVVGCTLVLIAVERVAHAPAARARELAEERLLGAVVPALSRDRDLTLDALPIPPRYWLGLGLKNPEPVRRVHRGNEVLAVIVPTISAQGYGGPIRLLVGVDPAGRITGVQVVAERETPGIGDRIRADRGPWMQGFTGTSRDLPSATGWRLRREGGVFDAITGATVSSRAVVRQVRSALDYVHDDRERLFRTRGDAINPDADDER